MNRMFSAGIFVFILMLVGKFSALGKDMAMSSIFGISWQADAYFIANGAPILVFSAFYASIPLVFLPLYNKVKTKEGSVSGFEFANNFINIFLFISFILSIVSILFAPNIIDLISQNTSEKVRQLSIDLARIFSLSFVFTMLVSVFTSMQYVNKSYLGTQLIPLINNSLVILAIVFLSKNYGIEVVAYFAVAAWVIQVPLQRYILSGGYNYNLYLNFKDKNVRYLFVVFVPAFFGVLIDQVNILVDLYLSSGLGEGAVASLNYASRLVLLVALLFPVVVTTIMYPYYSDYSVQNKIRKLSISLEKSIKIIFLLVVPVLVVSILFRSQIISLLFERGEFDFYATSLTSNIFLYYGLAIVFIGLREVFNKVLYAQQNTKTVLYISSISVFINVLLSVVLVEYFGITGIALATSISVLIHVIIQVSILHIKLGSRFYRKLTKFFLDLIVGVVVMVSVVVWLQGLDVYRDILFIWVLTSSLSVVSYIITLYFLKQREVLDVIVFVRSKLNYFKKSHSH